MTATRLPQRRAATQPVLRKARCKRCHQWRATACGTGLCAECRGRMLVGDAQWERTLEIIRETEGRCA